MGDVDVRVCESPDACADVVAHLIAEIARRGGHVAVSGGSTPGPAYRRAAELAPDWTGVDLWFADERCVPPDDSRSNFGLVRETLLADIFQPPVVRRVHGELPPDVAAGQYDEQATGLQLDLALLGIGPDGHTASLFPSAPSLEERERAAIAVDAQFEPFVPRVTLTIPVLSAAALVVFYVLGEDKADAVARAFGGEPDAGTPASLVRSAEGQTVAVLDHGAASLL